MPWLHYSETTGFVFCFYSWKADRNNSIMFEGYSYNCSGKHFFFIPSIDRVSGSDAQGKKIRFFYIAL